MIGLVMKVGEKMNIPNALSHFRSAPQAHHRSATTFGFSNGLRNQNQRGFETPFAKHIGIYAK